MASGAMKTSGDLHLGIATGSQVFGLISPATLGSCLSGCLPPLASLEQLLIFPLPLAQSICEDFQPKQGLLLDAVGVTLRRSLCAGVARLCTLSALQ